MYSYLMITLILCNKLNEGFIFFYESEFLAEFMH